MPFVVEPGSIPPPPVQVTGADGILTGTLRTDGAGVLLSADFTESVQVDQFSTDIAGWSVYSNGGSGGVVTLSHDLEALRIQFSGVTGGGSRGAYWSVPAAVPEAQWVDVSVVFNVSAVEAVGFRLSLNGVGSGWSTTDLTATPGAHVLHQRIQVPVAETLSHVYVYATGATSADLHIQDVSVVASSYSKHIERVRFVRYPDAPVRSGTDALASGLKALAFDHEAPIGSASTWYAYPVFDDGSVGEAADPVTLTLPTILAREVWVKSVTDPTLSVRATVVGPMGTITYPARTEYQDVLGSSFPVSAWDVWQSSTFELTFDVEDAASRTALHNCLTSGVLLLQANPGVDFEDVYVQAGDVTRSRYDTTRGVLATAQQVGSSFTEVARPSAVGAAMFVPSYSWADIDSAYSNWNHVDSVVENWAALATGDPGA